MNNFNLVLSTQHGYEQVAETEMWFQLMILGDSHPVIIHSSIPGILLVSTDIDPFKVIKNLQEIQEKDPEFFQFTLKIIPIERVIETDLDLMKKITDELILTKRNITQTGKFAIEIRKRSTEFSKKDIIDKIAAGIPNQVDLKNPDWIIWIEILGNITGISILNYQDIFSMANNLKEKKEIKDEISS